jgi:hypothetical protein
MQIPWEEFMKYESVTEIGNVYTKQAAWGAIFCGVVTAFGLQLMFGLLGLGLGLGVAGMGAGRQEGITGMGGAALGWWLLTGIISLFSAGWVAGRLAATPGRMSRALHGLVTWSLSATLTVLLLTSTIGALAGGGLALMKSDMLGGSSELSAAAEAAKEKMEDLSDSERRELERASKAAAAGALTAFFALLLGAVACTAGGALSGSGWPTAGGRTSEGRAHRAATA